MPDNITNAMKGLTQYLMVENQRLAVEREDKKINDASNQIAEAYKNLGPNATIEDIRKIQFASISSASNLGVIQEVMPLINQMQSSTLQTFAYNQTEKVRGATEKFLEDRYGTDLPDGADPIAMSNLMYNRQEKETVVDEEGITRSLKFDDTGKEISNRVVNAIGTKNKMDQYRQQKEIDYEFDSRLARLKTGLTNSMTGLTGTGPNFAGYDPLLNYQGQGGEILYKSKKGRGVYSLQPDGSLLFYNGQPQPTKGAVKDAVEMVGYKNQIESHITKGLADQMKLLLSTKEGKAAFKDLTGSTELIDVSKATQQDYETWATVFEKVATNNSWDTIKSKVGKGLSGTPSAETIWKLLSDTRTLPDQRKRADELLFGTTQAPEKIGGLTTEEFNDANEMMMEVFSPESTLSTTERASIKQWILNKVEPQLTQTSNMLGQSMGTYDDFKRLSKADQLRILRIINEKTIK